QLLTIHTDALKLVEENKSLKDQIRELKDRLSIKSTLIFNENSYWIPVDDGTQRELIEGPFCTLCWDKDNKLVRKHLDKTERWYCPAHEKADPSLVGCLTKSNEPPTAWV